MLQIQRASAGSGKTYALAKKYIWLLLTVCDEKGKCRLRTPREISEALPGIMAITFTNKATNEMKQRIVEKLSALAAFAGEAYPDPDKIKNTDYLAGFMKDLDADAQKIGIAARFALSTLLNKYSDFRISTIDAFFQEILRTFAYEANINDSYQLEIDSEYLGSAAIDSTLNDFDNYISGNDGLGFWIGLLMDSFSEKNNKWNLFNKKDTKDSIYLEIKQAIKNIDNEQFHDISLELESLFESDGTKLVESYKKLKADAINERKTKLDHIKDLAARLSRIILEENLTDDRLKSLFTKHLGIIAGLKYDIKITPQKPFSSKSIIESGTVFKARKSSPRKEEIDSLAMKMYNEMEEWRSMESTPLWPYWLIYGPLLPYLGIIVEVSKRMGDFLNANNLVRIGDTSRILKRIIGDNDTPFVYERLGTKIKNYLIDEFQDTSRMQWDVLKPLITESLAVDNENLLIGDAKQSIYRFRNADSSLITKTVPREFRHIPRGSSKEDNTNWRSAKKIVEFNNYFFRELAGRLTDVSREKGGGTDISDIYGNVIQFPSHRADNGYVEIRFINTGSNAFSGSADDEEEDSDETRLFLNGVGPLISQLMERGYSMKDIAILVTTNAQGKDVVEYIMDYNSTLEAGKKKIEIVSEESLLISSSPAVDVVITVLEKIVKGGCSLSRYKKNKIDDESSYGPYWKDIRTDFLFYSLNRPEVSPAERMKNFLEEKSASEAIATMLESMPTLALPAIVEAAIENFVPEESRKTDAVFLSAFQDVVLEYCSRYSGDPASFLEWWQRKGKGRTISSPEETDAVKIMTIHKSKGLEFRCVILPFAYGSLQPSSNRPEWRWVTPPSFLEPIGLPRYVPVKTLSNLLPTIHAPEYRKYFDQVLLDKINNYYVAFTRAIDELYIFTKNPSKNNSGLGSYLKEICSGAETEDSGHHEQSSDSWVINPGEFNIESDDTGMVVTLGEKMAPEKKSRKNSDEAGELDKDVIDSYFVNSKRPILDLVSENRQLLFPDAEEKGDVKEDAEEVAPEEETDPRSEGNILHAVMSRVILSSDLPKAFLAMRMKGLLSLKQSAEWLPLLEKALGSEEVKHWFDGTWQVINERELLNRHFTNRRPDRIMISPDRNKAIIIDYKFGTTDHDKSYRKQVNDYVANFREASGIRDVKGFLWYVKENRIEEVN